MKRVVVLMILAVSMLSVVGCNSIGGGKTSRNPAQNAAPLGLELGYADYAGFQSWLGEKLKKEKMTLEELKKNGMYAEETNENGNKIVEIAQDGLVEGMGVGKFLFDKSGVLAVVGIRRKGDINEIYKTMKSKYTLTSAEPKSGFTYTDIFASAGTEVEFKQGESEIILSQSIRRGVEIFYATNAYLKQSEEEDAKKTQKQKSSDASNL